MCLNHKIQQIKFLFLSNLSLRRIGRAVSPLLATRIGTPDSGDVESRHSGCGLEMAWLRARLRGKSVGAANLDCSQRSNPWNFTLPCFLSRLANVRGNGMSMSHRSLLFHLESITSHFHRVKKKFWARGAPVRGMATSKDWIGASVSPLEVQIR
jgi:hypothetical protein